MEESEVQAKNEGTISISSLLVEQPGKVLGRYRILQQIGEGGCGVVYLAEQIETLRRRVALKVIKPGMDSKQVLGRFEAERQVLALLDHPNIAKVLDAGATDNGRPFFVMELVQGIKITEYCDQNKLSTRERLELFAKVCKAIQHAHQKGIIHRDIKPSNILVTMADGVPVPKVIDFGIAKATAGQILTDRTIFTALEQFIGTPAYMSPEQAEMSSLDIDTRSDIYSLGVLMYELLTGKTPFDARRLLEAGLDEIRRIIREEEPARPSTRISDLDVHEQTEVARKRHAQLPKLLHQVRGELDWVVMRALQKDRTRRYETANGLAMDVERFLKHEPVLAKPPSNIYRLRKAIRRHKLLFATTASVGIALTVALVASTVAYRKTQAAEHRALIEAEKNRLASESSGRLMLALARGAAKRLERPEMRKVFAYDAMRRLENRAGPPEAQAFSCATMGKAFLQLGQLDEAARMQRKALEIRKNLLEARDEQTESLALLAEVLLKQGDTNQAAEKFRLALDEQWKPWMSNPALIESTLDCFTQLLWSQGRTNELDSIFDKWLATPKLEPYQIELLLQARGFFFARHERWPEAAGNFAQLQKAHPETPRYVYQLVILLGLEKRFEDCQRVARGALTSLGTTDDPVDARRNAKICLLTPRIPADLSEKAFRLAELGMMAADRPPGASALMKGLAEFRVGKFAESAARINEVIPILRPEEAEGAIGAQALLVLAMDYQRLNQLTEAKEILTRASLIVEKETMRLANEDPGELWPEILVARLFLSEAQSASR